MDLSAHGIHVADVIRNCPVPRLYAEALQHEAGSRIADSGALVAYSGEKTGRSPKDKRILKSPFYEDDVWWGSVNIATDAETFTVDLQRARECLNQCNRLFCVDAFAGWDPKHQIKVRTICSRPYHALFIHTMLIRPTREQLESFGEPDVVIYNAGRFSARMRADETGSDTSISLDLHSGEMVILGTEYAGEMKKGVFTVMNYLMPKRGILSMHCSATADAKTGSSSILFGLSGTGKTTLSADPKRQLVGDDEHCWTDTGIFNIEGGCYAKTINLSAESEPDIHQALRFGAVLENVVINESDCTIDFSDTRITENTRGAYPIEFIPNARIPCLAGHPENVIFLTCDAFGVLPPVSKLSQAQAMYHFISGYTAKVAGTEVGVTEPEATFSPCFGGPFLVWHPGKYAEQLAARMTQHKTHAWLVNTGWSGGSYGTGSRLKLKYTRAIIDAIHDGTLVSAPTQPDPIFGFEVVTRCLNVPAEILIPVGTWSDKSSFDVTANKLARLFRQNFKVYEAGVSEEVCAAGPTPAGAVA